MGESPRQMTPQEFIRKKRDNALSERSSAAEHFIDLCKLLGHRTPAEVDPKGEFFSIEKGLKKTGGGDGFADVRKRGLFAIEYKKRRTARRWRISSTSSSSAYSPRI